MDIEPSDLLSLRHEDSLMLYGPRCFAIIWGNEPFFDKIESFCEKVNKYNPHRVLLGSKFHQNCTSQEFAIVEMAYDSEPRQRYFTYLMWLLSEEASLWIHVWDTFENDAICRDFTEPDYMHSELGINRLWLNHQAVFSVERGYAANDPHGESVEAVDLQEAMDHLADGRAVKNDALTDELHQHFSGAQPHLIDHVRDYENVYIPNSLARLVLEHPHWISHGDVDPTNIVLDAIPKSVSLSDETAFTVATSDATSGRFTLEKILPDSLTTAQWIAVSIKVGANSAFERAKGNDEEMRRLASLLDVPVLEDCFGSPFLMDQLNRLGLASGTARAKSVHSSGSQLAPKWDRPVCVLSEKDRKVFEAFQEAAWKSEYEPLSYEGYDSNGEYCSDGDSENDAVFTGLEDTQETSRAFAEVFGEPSFPRGMSGRTALSKKELQQTDDLEDFDDFVEYYAKHFLGYDDDDLRKHRVHEDSAKKTEEDKDRKDDWDAYNEFSDYNSDYSEEYL